MPVLDFLTLEVTMNCPIQNIAQRSVVTHSAFWQLPSCLYKSAVRGKGATQKVANILESGKTWASHLTRWNLIT